MEKLYRHGDLLLKRINALPAGLIELDTKTLAHGEATGHHHTLVTGKSRSFAKTKAVEPEYLLVEQDAELQHQEHIPLLIGKGTYQIIREREYNPFEQEIRQVMD